MDSKNKEYLRIIRQAIERKKLSVFVGSAASYDSNMPSWSDLIERLKDSLDIKRNESFLRTAEHYYIQYGRNAYFEKISESFPKSATHNKLHELILDLNPQHIITTNWDDLLESAISKRGDFYFPAATDHQLASSPSSNLLVKMHGDLTHRNIVFKESDYLSYSDNFPLIENFVKSLFSTNVVLFIGYSISDYNLNQILTWIRNRTNEAPPAFTILTDDKLTLSEDNYLRGKGVFPILSTPQEKKYDNLSKTTSSVARILEEIVKPTRETQSIASILKDVSGEIDGWNIILPQKLVSLLRKKLSLESLETLRYDPALNCIAYSLRENEKDIDRAQYREIRRNILNLVRSTSIPEIHILPKGERFIRIRNKYAFNIINDYSTYNYEKIEERLAASASDYSDSDTDKAFAKAFDYYFVMRPDIAREIYQNTTISYFSKSNFPMSALSAYNKKHSCFGDIGWGNFEKINTIANSERLEESDDISSLISKFPTSIISEQRALYQGLDAENTLMLEQHYNISSLYFELMQETRSIKKGSIVFSNNIEAIHSRLEHLIKFILHNKVAILTGSISKKTLRLASEAILRRSAVNNTIPLTIETTYALISSFDNSKLKLLLSEILENKDIKITLSDEVISYIQTTNSNILKTLTGKNKSEYNSKCTNVWLNAILLLAYTKLDKAWLPTFYEQLLASLDSESWQRLTHGINDFIVHQFIRNNDTFTKDQLLQLFEKQITNLIDSQNKALVSDPRLLTNTIKILNTQNKKIKININIDLITKLIEKIKNLSTPTKINTIQSFMFDIYAVSSGEQRKKIKSLLLSTLKQARSEELNAELLAIYSLNLVALEVIQNSEIDTILQNLKPIAKAQEESKSASSYYTTLSEQIKIIPSEKQEQHSDVLKSISIVADRFKSSMLKI